MIISELSLTNYRTFSETTRFNFARNFTIIAGVNGLGKTSILDGLALVMSNLLPQISPARKRSKPVTDMDIHVGMTEATLAIKANCAGIPLQYSIGIDRIDRIVISSKLSKSVSNAIKSAYGDPNRAGDQAPLVVYYSVDRAGYRFPKALPKAVPVGQPMAYNGALLNKVVDFKDFMARLRASIVLSEEETIENNSYIGINTIRAINSAILSILPGFSNLRVNENPLRLLVDKENEELDLRQLSDGERSIIALICDLSRRLSLANPELDNPLLGAGVVLIDEIELHLHPKWQLEIAEKLRSLFPNIQFIVTTHSPFILQTARNGEIIKLDGQLVTEPEGKSLEDVAKFIMNVDNTEYSPRVKNMRNVAKEYMLLVDEARKANASRKNEIQKRLIELLKPYNDNQAYIAFLENRGYIKQE